MAGQSADEQIEARGGDDEGRPPARDLARPRAISRERPRRRASMRWKRKIWRDSPRFAR